MRAPSLRHAGVALGAALALAAAGCGSGDDGPASPTGAATTVGSVATTGPAGATTPPFTTTTATPAGLRTVTGEGYAFGVPASWRDRAGEVPTTPQSAIDAGDAVRDQLWADAPPGAPEPFTNLATTYDPLPAQGTTGPQTLDALTRATAASPGLTDDGGTVQTGPGTTLGGDPASTLVVRRPVRGDRIEQRQILAIHGGRLYTLTSTASEANAASAQAALEAARASWAWQDARP